MGFEMGVQAIMALINILKKSLNRILQLKQKKSQADLVAQMEMSVDTLQNYKMLAEMIAQNREKFMFPIRETHD